MKPRGFDFFSNIFLKIIFMLLGITEENALKPWELGTVF